MDQVLFKKWFGLARMYWRDAQGSGLPHVSQLRCYLAASDRIGVPKPIAQALFESGLDERRQPNARFFELADLLDASRA